MNPETENQEPENEVQETVALHEASNEDVKSALDEAIKKEQSEESGEGQEVSQSPDSSASNLTQEPVATEEAPQAATSNVAPIGTVPPAQSAQGQTVVPQQGLGNQKELLIRTRRSELAQMQSQISAKRDQLMQVKAQLEDGLREVYREDPYEGMQRQNRIAQIDNALGNLNAQEEQAVQIVESQSLFLTHIGDDLEIINSAVEMLRAEGIPEQYVQQFAQNPWTFTSPEGLVEIGKRAKLHREFKTADNDRNLLARHVLYLNKELEKARAKGQRTVAQIQRNLSQSPSVTARSSGAARTAGISPQAVANMTHAEVKQALAQAQAQEH